MTADALPLAALPDLPAVEAAVKVLEVVLPPVTAPSVELPNVQLPTVPELPKLLVQLTGGRM